MWFPPLYIEQVRSRATRGNPQSQLDEEYSLIDPPEVQLEPGDLALIPPGHDAWTVGEETCTIVDFGGMLL